MRRTSIAAVLIASIALVSGRYAGAGQAPFGVTAPEIPVTHSDRVYSAEQYSNTVSVTDPADNRLLGSIHLGNTEPSDLSPLYKGQLLVHGLGFSPDRRTVGVVSIGSNSVTFIDTATNSVKHTTYVGRSPHEAFFTPDGTEVWVTVRGENYVSVLDGTSYKEKTRIIVPITNHVNIVRNANGMFAYVTVGGLNEVQVYRTDNFSKVATIPVGRLPHGIWSSGDGTRVYVGLENEDGITAIDTLNNKVIATSPIGQAPQAVVYVPQAVPADTGTGNAAMSVMERRTPAGAETEGLRPLGIAGQSAQLWLAPPGQGTTAREEEAPTSVTLFDQGLVQVLEAAVTGLEPGKPYVLALANDPSGGGALEPLQGFMTNPAGSAIVNAVGPIRQVVEGADEIPRRYLVIVPGTADDHGAAVQVQRQ